MNDISFTTVRGKYGWLGNMSPHPLVDIHGRTWRTAEALFQSYRFDREDICENIRKQASPMSAKMIAKRYASLMVVMPRSGEDLDLMQLVLERKFEQHTDLRAKLIATGDARLIEDVTARASESGLFWGMGRIHVTGDWSGSNHLGRLLMAVRVKIQEAA